jgi:hypothetical protein
VAFAKRVGRLDESEKCVDGNILNSNGIEVAVVRGSEIFDLKGRKIYQIRNANIYKITGELVGHLNNAQGTVNRLDKSTDRLFARS